MQCKKCDQPTVGQSRYCVKHRAESRANFKAMCAAQAAEREERDAKFRILHRSAHEAGMAAGEAAVPQAMVVEQRANPLDDLSVLVKTWTVTEGLCGFAWINIRPGNCAFANWAKNNLGARRGYTGGVEIWVDQFNQSVERKQAYAHAYARVLKDAGINAYAGSRLD